MRRSFVLELSIAMVLAGGGRRASAAERAPVLDLTWTAPAGCPPRERVTREVEELLGDAAPSAGRMVATAEVSATAGGFVVALTTKLDGSEGHRTFEGRTCEAVAHATAMVLAFALDPSRQSVGVVATDPPPAAREAVPSSDARGAAGQSSHARGDGAAVRNGHPTAFAVGAGAAATVGALPGLSAGPSVWLAHLRNGWRFDLTFTYFPPSSARVDAVRGGDFQLVAGSVRACHLWNVSGDGITLGPCVGVEGGVVAGEAVGVRFPGSGVAPWVAPRASLLGAARLGSVFWLVGGVEAELAVSRHRFAVDGIGIVHQPSPIGARATIGAEARF